MKKKTKKISKESLKINTLTGEIRDKDYEIKRLTQKVEDLYKSLNSLQSYRDQHEGSINTGMFQLDNQVKNLLEIIRWQTNPETTRFPFAKDVVQKEEGVRNCYPDKPYA